MKKMILISAIALIAGCAFFRQVSEDYRLNKKTPYASGEVTVERQSQVLTNTISGIPYANLVAPLVAIVAPLVLGWLRGRRLRKGGASKSATSSLLNTVIKNLDTARAGIFESGPDGSALKRGWKIALLSFAGLTLAPVIHNSLIPFISMHHPAWLNGAGLSLLIGSLAAMEKKISNLNSALPSVSANP